MLPRLHLAAVFVAHALLPETMITTWVFLAVGFVALFWLRRTGQLRLS